jgi:serine/threonine-protein kinase
VQEDERAGAEMSERNFFAELKRRNVYKVAVAYAVVGWLLVQVTTQVFPIFEIPNWALRLIVLVIIIGFPIALVLAWAFELTPEGIKRTEVADETPTTARQKKHAWIYIVVIGAAISAALFFLGRYTAGNAGVAVLPSAVAQKSIAVLPFVDLSQAKDQEYFCDGISEEILDTLAKVEGLRVVARTSSFSFKGKNADVGQIAQKLNVQNILEGSLRREGNRIRITAQLVNAANGFHLWSETYERELQGVFAVQDEITRAIVDALKIKLAIAPSVQLQPNSEAHDLYLQGLYFSNKSGEEDLRRSLDFFQRALQKDPNYAKAWTGIAKAWEWLADVYVKPLEAYPAMRAAAAKAIALDEKEAEAHVYLGDSQRVLNWDVAGCEAELKRALQLDPNCGIAQVFTALSIASQGGPEAAALMHVREAVKVDPLSPIISTFAGFIDIAYGRLDDAIAEGRRMQFLDPNYLYQGSQLAVAYREKGMFAEALELYKKAAEVSGIPQPGLAVTYAKMGRRSDAERVLGEVKTFAAAHYFAGEEIASIYVALGDNDAAFQWLDRAYQEHSGSLHGIVAWPIFRPLHSDPRFAALLKRMGLDPAKALVSPNKP